MGDDNAQLDPLPISSLRASLIRQEETIIFALIERAQFARNEAVYRAGDDGLLHGKAKGENGSFLDFMLKETERVHGLVGRFSSPDENAFFPNAVPSPILTSPSVASPITPNTININSKIRSVYERQVLPRLAASGDDRQYGSTTVCDIAVLQALSKRIHFGKYIAESKFRTYPEKYKALIAAKDADGILDALTIPHVEKQVLERVRTKAATYGKDPQQAEAEQDACKVNPDVIHDLYRDWVMPLTKEVEVNYLLHRVDPPTVAFVCECQHANAEPSQCSCLSLEAARAMGNTLGSPHATLRPFPTLHTAVASLVTNEVGFVAAEIESPGGGINRSTQAVLLPSQLKVCGEVAVVRGAAGATRFFAVCKHFSAARCGNDKSVVMFTLPHEPGALSKVLGVLTNHKVNLRCIASNVLEAQPASFYAELDGHAEDEAVKAALLELRHVTTEVRVVGSFENLPPVVV